MLLWRLGEILLVPPSPRVPFRTPNGDSRLRRFTLLFCDEVVCVSSPSLQELPRFLFVKFFFLNLAPRFSCLHSPIQCSLPLFFSMGRPPRILPPVACCLLQRSACPVFFPLNPLCPQKASFFSRCLGRFPQSLFLSFSVDFFQNPGLPPLFDPLYPVTPTGSTFFSDSPVNDRRGVPLRLFQITVPRPPSIPFSDLCFWTH